MSFDQVIIQDNVYIPEQMFDYVVNFIITNKQNLYQFKYSELIKYTFNYDYQKAAILRKNLAKYSQQGSYYILFCQYEEKLYLDYLRHLFTEKQIKQLYNQMHSIMGITRYGFFNKLNGTQKNCLTILNKSLLQMDDWLSTLQHQMTHFIQRFIGLDNTVDKKYQKKIDKKDKHPDIIRLATKITKYVNEDQKFIDQLIKKFTYMLAKNELQQTLKTLLVMFKNMYQRIITYQNGKIANIDLISDYSNKQQWLKQILKKINSNEYLQSKQFKQALQLWKKKSILCSEEQLVKHRYISYILCYLAVKNILPELNIDKKLEQYFETLGE